MEFAGCIVPIPPVAKSGLTETVEAEKLAALGVPDVLTKPCDGPTLLNSVHRRLSRA